MKSAIGTAAAAAMTLMVSSAANAQVACALAGPQTPRDIASMAGTNRITWPFAPAASQMNLCDIHTHTNAEHKGPGFSLETPFETVTIVLPETGEQAANTKEILLNTGYRCNETNGLTPEELAEDHSGGHAVKPGDTIEVHWVHTTCPVAPGPGLGSCLCDDDGTGNTPQLRVEAQVFLVVNNHNALNFRDFVFDGDMAGGFHQAKALPSNTGTPVQFLGSTTGPGYNSTDQCSAPNVTWSVRPQCAKVDVASVNGWFAIKGNEMGQRPDGTVNVFKENHSHGVRQLVVNPALLSEIGG